jgi:DNA-binding GntR family transcriptional regulator
MTTKNVAKNALDLRPLNERVYEVILQRILSGQLRPGQRLDPDELCQELGVSRTPVKDAISRLAAEGMLEVSPRRGTCVVSMTEEDALHLFDVRRMIETYAAERAVINATPADIAKIDTMIEHLKSFMVGDGYSDYLAFLVEDHEMHSYIVRLAGNPRINALYESTRIHIRIARIANGRDQREVTDAEATHQEHIAIARAFADRSVDGLKHAIAEHLNKRGQWFGRTFGAQAVAVTSTAISGPAGPA